MRDTISGAVQRLLLDGVRSYTISNLDAEPLPEMMRVGQYFQNVCPLSNCFCRAYHRPSLGLSNSDEIQNTTFQWPVSVPNDPPASHDLDTLYQPAVMSQTIELSNSEAETSHNGTHYADQSPPFSTLDRQPESSLHSGSTSPPKLNIRTSEPPSQAVTLSPSQECYNSWKNIPMDAIIVTGSGTFVPQRLYKPLTEADKERYLEQIHLSPPIIFMTKEPFEWGIPLEDIRNGKTKCLVDRDVPVLQNCGPSVSIRINWPGYPSFKRQISSRNWRKIKGPITKERLAQNLAKTTSQFIEKMSRKPFEIDTERIWRVGNKHIKVEDLILVSLHHVSKGSWQPQFRLRRELA